MPSLSPFARCDDDEAFSKPVILAVFAKYESAHDKLEVERPLQTKLSSAAAFFSSSALSLPLLILPSLVSLFSDEALGVSTFGVDW
jgi:hypothetical protein